MSFTVPRAVDGDFEIIGRELEFGEVALTSELASDLKHVVTHELLLLECMKVKDLDETRDTVWTGFSWGPKSNSEAEYGLQCRYVGIRIENFLHDSWRMALMEAKYRTGSAQDRIVNVLRMSAVGGVLLEAKKSTSVIQDMSTQDPEQLFNSEIDYIKRRRFERLLIEDDVYKFMDRAQLLIKRIQAEKPLRKF